MKPKNLLVFAFWLAAVAAIVSVTTLPVLGQGSRDQLKGTYFITGENGCLLAPSGFDPVTLVPLNKATAFYQSSGVRGTLQVNGDGTGTGEFTELVLTPPPAGNPNAAATKYPVSFTYTIASDGTLTVVFSTITGTLTAGPSAGATFTVLPPPLSGRVAKDGSAIMLSSIEPTVETLHIVGGPSFPRICYRTRVQIPVH